MGKQARFGLDYTAQPRFRFRLGARRDGHSIILDGEACDFGGGVRLQVRHSLTGARGCAEQGRIAEFPPWWAPMWFAGEYDARDASDHAGPGLLRAPGDGRPLDDGLALAH